MKNTLSSVIFVMILIAPAQAAEGREIAAFDDQKEKSGYTGTDCSRWYRSADPMLKSYCYGCGAISSCSPSNHWDCWYDVRYARDCTDYKDGVVVKTYEEHQWEVECLDSRQYGCE